MAHIETALSHPGLLGRVLEWLRRRAGGERELAGFSRAELRQMATDLSLAESDMLSIATAGRDNTVLMEGMMRARGFDPERMRREFATLLRDVEFVCTRCRSTGRCRRELDACTAAAHSHDYCPNASTFDALSECPWVPRFP